MVLYSMLFENLHVSLIVLVTTCLVKREGDMNHDLSHAALSSMVVSRHHPFSLQKRQNYLLNNDEFCWIALPLIVLKFLEHLSICVGPEQVLCWLLIQINNK